MGKEKGHPVRTAVWSPCQSQEASGAKWGASRETEWGVPACRPAIWESRGSSEEMRDGGSFC